MNDECPFWNSNLINELFPSQVRELIINTPILDVESDNFVWTPSMSGSFTVKSAYHSMLQGRQGMQINEDLDIWKCIWKAKLHKILLWRVALYILPTADRLNKFMNLSDPKCFLCGQHTDTIHHWLLKCPVSKMIWWNSPWQIRLEVFQQLTTTEWLYLIIKGHNVFHLQPGEKNRMRQFLVVMVEQIWFIRNKIWKGVDPPEWTELSKLINGCHVRY